MPRVICELPNASDMISGVPFHLLDDGRRISDEVAQEVAERFCSIAGYSLDEDGLDVEPPAPETAPKLTKAQQKAADKKAAEEKAATEAAAAAEKAAQEKAEQEKAEQEAAEAAAKQLAEDENKGSQETAEEKASTESKDEDEVF